MKPNHLLSVEDLSCDQIEALLSRATVFMEGDRETKKKQETILKNKFIVNLFLENSTRTKISFECAAKRLGASLINFDADTSSLNKGETLLDTVASLQAMGVDGFIVRHREAGLPEKLAKSLELGHIINGGDGCRAHPTQALADLFTMRRFQKNFPTMRVTIVGDIKHSRVARSQIAALKIMGVNAIQVVAPSLLIPEDIDDLGVTISHDLTSGIKNADVVMALRIQQERFSDSLQINTQDYFQQYGISEEVLAAAKPDAIVMHPGPVNHGVEMAEAVALGPQSVIVEQVRSGVFVRMAVLEMLLGENDE